MEEGTFLKDTKPYLVFQCSNCSQFSYVKITQKTKKCLRCGWTHQVRNILKTGEIINGMTEAVNIVKEKQTALGLIKANGYVTLTSENNFILMSENKNKILNGDIDNRNYYEKFLEIINILFRQYKTFPRYMMEILAEDKGIPASKLNLLIREFQTKGVLSIVKDENYYYTIKKT